MEKLKRPLAWVGIMVFLMLRVIFLIRPLEIYDAGKTTGQRTLIEGRVSDRFYKNDFFILEIHNVRVLTHPADKEKSQKTIKYLRGAYLYLDIENGKDPPVIGQSVRIRGNLHGFERAVNPGQFDIASYRAIHDIDISVTGCEILARGKRYDLILEKLKRIREKEADVFDRYLSDEDSGVVKAMLLGDRNSLDENIGNLYRNAGIAHLLSISGLHVGVIGIGLYKFLKKIKIKRTAAVPVSCIFVAAYGEMTGGSVSVIRASIMLGICLTAEIIGRSYDLLSAMSLSLLLILTANPKLCLDPGFLLSFGAISGIALSGSWISYMLPKKGIGFLSALAGSISVSIFTLPLILYFYFQTAILSIFLNMIVIPLMTILIFSAFLLAFLGSLNLPLTVLPALSCKLILYFYKILCIIFTGSGKTIIVAGRPALWKILIYYAVFLTVCFITPRIKKLLHKRLYILASMALMLSMMFFNPSAGLRYFMLDIGQGDCNFIKSPSGKCYMIDCGSSDEKEIAKYKVIPALRSMGVSKIDTAIMTHSDADHINGFMEIFNMDESSRIGIKTLLMPDIDEPDEAYMELVRLAEKNKVKVRLIKKGDVFEDGEMTVKCLNPEKGGRYEDPNPYSTVLEVRYRKFSILLTGDVEGENEEKLIKEIDRAYTVLKVAHHGSKNSSPENLIEKIDPEFAFISCGRNNRYGHPHEETMEKLENAGAKTFITKENGAISVETDGKKIRVSTYLKGNDSY